MKHLLERTWAQIDLDALYDNFAHIRSLAASSCRVMAVVKADAYGHGAVMAAKTLQQAGADWLAVSNLDEAIQLRQAGLSLPILILSYTPPDEAATLAHYRITQTVVSAPHAHALSQAAVQAGVTLPVHIKLDTGMSRVGFFCQQPCATVADEIADACALPGLHAEGIFTHFAVSDEPTPDSDAFTQRQFDRFMQILDLLHARGIAFSLRHCCNSAATMRFPHMHLDMVRPGLILYGLYPDKSLRPLLPLTPVMSLCTRVSQTKWAPAGSSVSYGRQYTAQADTRLATVPIGYADGYTRRSHAGAYMLVNGRPAPVCGRICMDQCVLDVTGIDDVQEGTVAVAFGTSGNARLPVETYASWSDTINYEAVCAVGKRVPRLFWRDRQPVSVQNDLI